VLALIGFLMVGIIVYLLIQSKATPAPVFVIVPLAAAAATGSSFVDITKFIKSGVATTMPIAILFMFSVIFFSVMTDAGMFDPLVNFLSKKAGNNVVAVTVATGIIATIAHLDGSLAATLLVTVPAMLPLYKRLNIRPVVLLVIIGAAMSIMNLVPWGGPVARVAAITKVDINTLWHTLIPLQVVGVIIVLLFAAFMGALEKRRGAGMSSSSAEDFTAATVEVDPKVEALKRPKLVWFNVLLTLGVIGLMCFTKIELYAAFMIGLAIALIVNYPDIKDQNSRMKAHAANALSMATILVASGVFLGVLSGAKMLDAMASSLLAVIPNFVGPYLHLVMGAFAVPIGMLLGTDSYFFGLVPLAIGVGSKFGVDPVNMSTAMLIGKNFGVLTTPHAATTYLAMGLAGVELKELLYYCMPRLWALSIVSLIAAIVLGIVII
jgi:CitMHS family citrate-Mg2+:H+ or citrate-Ca2+:H+ symporter